MWQLRRTFEISAAHFMPDDAGPCGRMHGHNYAITVALAASSLDHACMIVNALSLDATIAKVKDRWDHRLLNDQLLHPTIEVLAREIYDQFKADWHQTIWVEVNEGLGICCRYREKSRRERCTEGDHL
jgi:6-pyruvoyltetrahydropterin/6-carboxytetrahydropterin synthase